MGRYYSGDIEGKFWFGVQSSDDAKHFGGIEVNEIDEESEEVCGLRYSFGSKDLEDINTGILECIRVLGDNLGNLGDYFSEGGKGYLGYNPVEMCKDFGLPTEGSHAVGKEYRAMMEWYARYLLGIRIRDCVVEKGKCEFDCEI